MSGDNVDSHIDEMEGYAEHLNSFISTSNPLTADNVHAAALLISLPDEWLHCVTSLMNKERVSLAKLVTALKQEAYRRKSCNEDGSNPTSVSSAKTSKLPTKEKKEPRTRFCTFCKKEGHSLFHCCQTAQILQDHKSNHPAKRKTTPGQGSSARPADTAGHTSATPLGGNEHKAKSDFSGSKVEVTASNAVCSLFASGAAQPLGDTNLDSGCSMTMTPYLSLVHSLCSDCTPVRLADHSMVEATHKGIIPLPLRVDGNTFAKVSARGCLYDHLGVRPFGWRMKGMPGHRFCFE
jgi:hypothetical protein